MTPAGLAYAAAALTGVLLLITAAGRAARAMGLVRRAGTGRLELADSLTLDGKRRLLLIQCDGRQFLLLTGPRDLVIGWLDVP